jgi:hypothetical protein
MLHASKGAGDAASVAAGDSCPSTTLMVRGPNTESSALCAMLVPTPQPIPEPHQKNPHHLMIQTVILRLYREILRKHLIYLVLSSLIVYQVELEEARLIQTVSDGRSDSSDDGGRSAASLGRRHRSRCLCCCKLARKEFSD